VLLAGYVVVRSLAVTPPAEPTPSSHSASVAATTAAGRAVANQISPRATSTMSAAVLEADGPPERSCAIEQRGRGPYEDWIPLPVGKLLRPDPPPTDRYVLLVHFHGAEAVRRLLGPAATGVVVAALDAGEGSQRYAQAFHGPEALDELLGAVDEQLAPARRSRLIVSAWSAGYGAVRNILEHDAERVDAVLLLDALHASYDDEGRIDHTGLLPFLRYAERAQQGDALFTLTHSEITPPSFASTREVASLIIDDVGGQRRYAGLRSMGGVALKTEFRERGLVVRGLTGSDRAAHCAHLRLLPRSLRDLL